MEKLKEFMRSPKKTAILGLVSSILMILYVFFNNKYNFIVLLIDFSTNLFALGFTVYFSIVLLRLIFCKGNIKFANLELVITLSISIIISVGLFIYYGGNINNIIYLIINLIILLYLYNILIQRKIKINNKIFGVTIILFIIWKLFNIIINKKIIVSVYNNFTQNFIFNILRFIMLISYIGVIPYFYNYYEILKGEQKNGK